MDYFYQFEHLEFNVYCVILLLYVIKNICCKGEWWKDWPASAVAFFHCHNKNICCDCSQWNWAQNICTNQTICIKTWNKRMCCIFNWNIQIHFGTQYMYFVENKSYLDIAHVIYCNLFNFESVISDFPSMKNC